LSPSGARFHVRVTPRGGEDRVDGIGPDGELRCRVRAAPADGKANEALIRLIAAACDAPRSTIIIESGMTGRHKRVRVEGVGAARLAATWPGLAVEEAGH
jgi:uncharacterized protein